MEIKIQGTNDFSTVSKCSMVKRGYFNDDYISEFISRCHRRAPIIHMGYFVRAEIIDNVLKKFCKVTNCKKAQIISCGAGFDSNYFRLCSNGELHSGIVYFEIDFLDVISRKAEFIKNSAVLSKIINQYEGCIHANCAIGTSSYHLIAGDMRNLEQIENILKNCGIDWNAPTIFLAECSITYMDEESSTCLINWASQQFLNASFITFEQIQPDDGFGIIMKQHFDNLGSPLKSLDKYPTLLDQENRYKSCGWPLADSKSIFDLISNLLSSEDFQRVFCLEPFDEFESWHLMCCHYALTVAAKGNLLNWFFERNIKTTNHDWGGCNSRKRLEWELIPVTGKKINRFCHASVFVESTVLLFGGFGLDVNGSHRRLDEICAVDISSLNISGIIKAETLALTGICPIIKLDAVHMTCNLVDNNTIVILGGRTSPLKPLTMHPVLILLNEKEVKRLSISGPPQRWRHSAAILKKTTDFCFIAVFGGRTATLEVLDDLWLFDYRNEKFFEVKSSTPSPCARFSHSATSVGNCSMIISGGMNSSFKPLNDVWCFNLENYSWKQLVLSGPAMLPRYCHTSAVTSNDSKLLLLGGVNCISDCQPGLAVIDLIANRCVEYALPTQDPERPVILHHHSTELITNSTLLVFGGGDNCFSFGTHFNSYVAKIELSEEISEDFVSS